MSYGVPYAAKLFMFGKRWNRTSIGWMAPGSIEHGTAGQYYDGKNTDMMDLIWCHRNQDRLNVERIAAALGVDELTHPEYDIRVWLDLLIEDRESVISVLLDLRKAQAVNQPEPGVVDGSAVVRSGEPGSLDE